MKIFYKKLQIKYINKELYNNKSKKVINITILLYNMLITKTFTL